MDRRRQLRLWLLALDRFEVKLRGSAGKARNAFVRQAAKNYETSGSVPAHLLNGHRSRVAEALAEQYLLVIPHFAAMALKQVKSRRVETKRVMFASLAREWVVRESLRKAKLIADTDRDDVLRAIEAGLAEGQGTAEIASNIRRVSQLTPFRAATVARTETHAAATYASVESVRSAERELGVRMLKEWGPTVDDRTRPEHAAMSGYGPIPLDEKFVVGGEQMDRPGDPAASAANQINCRCTVFYTEAE